MLAVCPAVLAGNLASRALVLREATPSGGLCEGCCGSVAYGYSPLLPLSILSHARPLPFSAHSALSEPVVYPVISLCLHGALLL
ncbi:hypothetical protein BV20DRAFT_959671 [Pilatotrama ljubarskyi]|nr:hypothetical protein BV20DRAFT_959671 [Pilatotrama ljubarskyi]